LYKKVYWKDIYSYYFKKKKKIFKSDFSSVNDKSSRNNVFNLNDKLEFLTTKENNNNKYNEKQYVESQHWKNIENIIFDSLIDMNSFSIDICSCCNSSSAIYHCLDCGSNIYFCKECNEQIHMNYNQFHRQISYQEPHKIIKKVIKLPPMCGNNCEHDIYKITAITLKGKT
jgi:hypothetical protein